jgi:hypothetical protein
MKEPTIAVVLPNWNDARYLARCIRSVLDQDAPPDELLIVDDASTDDSVATIQALIRGEPRARFSANPVNLGANRTVNESLARVDSEYVLLLSANDFVLPGIFARARKCLARLPPPGLWSAMAWLVDEGDRTIRLHASAVMALKDTYLSPERCARLAYRVGNWFTGPTLIYHRETLRSVGGFDPAYGAPADFFTAVTVASLRGAAYSPEPLAAVRLHAGSYSSRALNDIAGIDGMLAHLRARSPQLCGVSSDGFCKRTAARYRFAAVRASAGALIPDVATRETGWKRTGLRALDALLPQASGRVRVALAFLILRPFDIVPTLVNRLLGWFLVRARLAFEGKGPP